MVLISIHPFALRKVFLVIVAFLCFSALCLADPLLMAQRYGTHSRHLPPASLPRQEENEGWLSGGFNQRQLERLQPREPGRDAAELLPIDTQAGDYLPSEDTSAVFQHVKYILRADCSKSCKADEIVIHTGKV